MGPYILHALLDYLGSNLYFISKQVSSITQTRSVGGHLRELSLHSLAHTMRLENCFEKPEPRDFQKEFRYVQSSFGGGGLADRLRWAHEGVYQTLAGGD